MEITVNRMWPNDECATGVLAIDGQQVCFTLEPPVREIPGLEVSEWKVKDSTAIPRGRYKVVWEHSERFGHDTPRLVDVPGFEAVLLHGGNTAADTEACILIADKRLSDTLIQDSPPAISAVYGAVQGAIEHGEEVWITVQ